MTAHARIVCLKKWEGITPVRTLVYMEIISCQLGSVHLAIILVPWYETKFQTGRRPWLKKYVNENVLQSAFFNALCE